MIQEELNFSKAGRFIPFIILLGMGIGVAAYFMGTERSLLQQIVLHVVTSLVIGYSLLVVIFNKTYLFRSLPYEWQRMACLLFLFFIVGLVASEIEQVFTGEILSSDGYKSFTGGNLYLINGILSTVIGFGNYLTIHLIENNRSDPDSSSAEVNDGEPIFQIPVKQGESIVLIPVEDVHYFEAYDNYSFVVDQDGEKRLCDFSLIFLESRLGKDFIRVHRKYIVNRSRIATIKPHLNRRYMIEMKNGSSVTSSKSYAHVIKELIKLQ